jgi:hypothetical protein
MKSSRALLLVFALTATARADEREVSFTIEPGTRPTPPLPTASVHVTVKPSDLPPGIKVHDGKTLFELAEKKGAFDLPMRGSSGQLAFYVGGGSPVQTRLWNLEGEHEVEVTLGSSTSGVRGKVLYADGSPMPKANVWFEGHETGDDCCERGFLRLRTETDDAGHFAVPYLPEVDATITVSQDESSVRHASWAGRVGAAGRDVELRENTGWIRGTVFAADGSPVDSSIVLVKGVGAGTAAPGLVLAAQQSGQAYGGVAVRADGRFRVAVAGGGRYVLALHQKGSLARDVTPPIPVRAGECVVVPPLELDLAPETPDSWVKVQVSPEKFARAGAGVAVAFCRGDPEVVEQWCCGSPSIPAAALLAPGVYTVRLVQPGRETWVLRNVRVEAGRPILVKPTPP